MWIAVVVAVLVAALVAVVATSGSDDDPAPTAGGVGDDGSETVAAQEQADVQVSGTALAPFEGGPDPAVGQVAPQLTGVDFSGNPVSVAADGVPSVLVFVTHWCPHCQAEVPVLVQHFADAGLPQGVDVVAVSTSATDTRPNYPPSAWLAGEDWDLPVLVDDADATAAEAFGLTGFPYFVALDAENRVVARASGELGVDAFDALAAAALDGTQG